MDIKFNYGFGVINYCCCWCTLLPDCVSSIAAFYSQNCCSHACEPATSIIVIVWAFTNCYSHTPEWCNSKP